MVFFKIQSYRSGAIASILFSGISKGLAFFQSVVLAFYFGANFQTDVYFLVYTTITLFASYIISLNYLVLIPEAMRIRSEVSRLESQRFLNLFLYGMICLVLLLQIYFYCSPTRFFSTFSQLDSNILEAEKRTMIWFMPVLLFIVLTSFFTDILTSEKYFAFPLIVNSINSLLTVVSVFLSHRYLGIGGAVLGIYIGYSFNLFMLTLILVKRLKWNFFSINFKVQKRVVKNIGYAYLSQITTFLGSFLPVYLISSFSSGIMTSLNYAQRISQIPEQLIITQTSAVLGIKLNELNVKKQNNDVNRVLLEVASSTLFLTVPFSFLFALYGEKIVEMIYMRGRFDVASVNSTGVLLKYLGLSIPFVALNAFYSRVFIAFQRMKLAFYSGLVVNVLFLVLIYSFIQLLGPIGYPIAIATYLVCSVMIFFPFLFYWRVPEIDVAALSKCVFRVYIVNAILNFPVWLLLNEDIDLNIFLYAVWIVSCLVILNYYFKTSMHLYNFQKMILKKIGVSKIRFS